MQGMQSGACLQPQHSNKGLGSSGIRSQSGLHYQDCLQEEKKQSSRTAKQRNLVLKHQNQTKPDQTKTHKTCDATQPEKCLPLQLGENFL